MSAGSVPRGPLAARWLGLELGQVQAGAAVPAVVSVENAGTAAWHARGEAGVLLSYHWLDERGNPLVWDGRRFGVELAPGERAELAVELRAPIPPGRYRLAVDLVDEGRFWFAELGGSALERDVDVLPRDASEARAWLVDDVEPAHDWEERVRAAHEEGYGAVGGSFEQARRAFGRRRGELEPWAPGGGRNPAFRHPLLCPSLLPGLEPNDELHGFPAWRPDGDEPWLYDARIVLRLRPRSGRRRA